jgi:aminoglycoside phosphotransferase (APT) family kinase protein
MYKLFSRYLIALVLNLLKDIFERSGIFFYPNCYFIALCFIGQLYAMEQQDLLPHNDVIYNGFKQFLGDIYHYKFEQQLLGGIVNSPPCVYRVNDNKYVVRTFKGSPSVRQNRVATHLFAANKCLAPKIYHHHHDDDFSFLIMDFIEVPTLSFEQAHKSEVLALIGQKVRSIAQFDITIATNNRGNLFDEIMKHYKRIKSKKLLELDPIIEELKSKAEILHQTIKNENRPLVINHNDFHLRNLFFSHDDIVIIDWDRFAQNYEFCDLALYSTCSCLNESDDYSLLAHYLQRTPLSFDIQSFRKIKLMMRIADMVTCFDCVESVPESLPMEAIKDLEYYSIIFAQSANDDSPEFFYALGMSELREFREEYKKLEGI